MNEYTFAQLIDVEQVRHLLESHHHLSGMAYGLSDNNENDILSVGGQDICTRFHRAHPVCSERCRKSNAFIKPHLHEVEGSFIEYRCGNGMIDVAMPIIIEGRRLATFFVGQFFYDDDPPDRAFFLGLTREFGFDQHDYLAALERVPLFSREHIRANVMFLHSMVRILAESGLKSLRLTNEMQQSKLLEERYALSGFALDQIHEAAFLMDTSGRFQYVNQEACRSLGFSKEELLGMAVPDIDPDYSVEVLAQSFERLHEQGTQTFETRHRARDGRIFPVEIMASLFEHNGVSYNLALVRDISERKQMEEQLHRREQEFRAVVENSPDIISRYDRECRRIYVNPALAKLLGRPMEEVIGAKPTDLSPLPDAEQFEQMVHDVWEKEGEFRCEVQFLSSTGELRWSHHRIVPELGPDGKIVSVLSIGRDISELKETGRLLQESHARMRQLLRTVPDLVWLKDLNGTYMLCNQAFEWFYGTGESEIIGKTDYDFFDAEQADLWRDKDREALSSGNILFYEEWVTYRDVGRRGLLETRKVPMFSADGDLIGVLGIARDITERRRMEDALRNAHADLERRVAERTAELAEANTWLRGEIEERRRAEAALRESESFVNALLDAMPIPVFYKDRDGRYLGLNRAFEAFTGKSRELVIGKSVFEISRPTQAKTYHAKDMELYEQGGTQRYESHVENAHGKLRDVIFNKALFSDSRGNIRGLIGAVIDITERKRAAEALQKAHSELEQRVRERTAELEVANRILAYGIGERRRIEEQLRYSEQQFRTLAENSPGMIIRYDHECRRVYVNPAFSRETGFDAKTALGVSLEDAWIHGANVTPQAYTRLLRHVMATGAPAEILLEWPNRDTGRLSSHLVHIVAERDADGEINGCLAIDHDITRLRETELKLAKLAENSPGVMYTLRMKPDGTICMPYASPRLKDLHGLQSEDIVEDMSKAFALLHPDDIDDVRDSMAEAARTFTSWRHEFRVLHPAKGELWLEGHASPEPEPDGGIMWYGFLHDVTERKRSEEVLLTKRAQLAALATELSLAEERERQNIAAVLHDHIGQTLLLSRIKLGTLAREITAETGKKMAEEAKTLLDQVTHDIHNLTVQMNPPILAAVGLEAALEWLGRRMEEDYGLFVEFEDDLEEKPLLDEVRSVVYQCGRELLINVAKHANTDHARIVVGRKNDSYRLTVEDDGAGFDPANLAPDASRDCRFGLLSTQIRIERMGGSVAFESAPGQGSRMTILAPLAHNQLKRKTI